MHDLQDSRERGVTFLLTFVLKFYPGFLSYGLKTPRNMRQLYHILCDVAASLGRYLIAPPKTTGSGASRHHRGNVANFVFIVEEIL